MLPSLNTSIGLVSQSSNQPNPSSSPNPNPDPEPNPYPGSDTLRVQACYMSGFSKPGLILTLNRIVILALTLTLVME